MSATLSWIDHLGRPRRRLIVLSALVCYPAAVVSLVALEHATVDQGVTLAVFVLLMLCTVSALVATYGYGRARLDGCTTHLDERDLDMREHAYALAHRFLAAVLIAATAILEVYLTNGNTLHVHSNDTLPVMMWVLVFVPALPSLMLAWIEPTRPVDE